MSKKQSAAQAKRTELKVQELQKQFDELNAIENPTEEQLAQLEAVEEQLVSLLEDQMEDTEEPEELTDGVLLSASEMPKNYKVPKGEEHLVHAVIRIGSRFNPETGKPEHKANIQKFGVTEFKNIVKTAGRTGIKYGILHEPKK